MKMNTNVFIGLLLCLILGFTGQQLQAQVKTSVTGGVGKIENEGSDELQLQAQNSLVRISGSEGDINASLRVSDEVHSTLTVGHFFDDSFRKVLALGGNFDHILQFGEFQNDLSEFTPKMTFGLDGNVGIGTTDPTEKLHIIGNTKIEGRLDIATTFQNILIGNLTGVSNTTGQDNIFIGLAAGNGNEDGFDNVAVGRAALADNKNGFHNTANGSLALNSNVSGVGNTANGREALFTNTAGDNNTAVGFQADVSAINLVNATAIGALATVNASNKMQLGASTTTLSTSGGYTIVSDGRFKKNVRDDIAGLDFIMNLKPVSYRFDYQQYDDFLRGDKGSEKLSEGYKQQLKEKTKERELGFIAQEVANTADELNIPFSGIYRPQHETDNYALDYGRLSVPLVKATQEQQAEIEALKAENAELKQRLAKIEALLSRKVETNSTTSTLTSAILQQNTPNPFTEATSISYFIPEGTKNASLQVLDQNGRIIKTIPIQATGEGQVTLQANLLSAGTYSYALILDGQVMETKQMVLTK
jgi:hypothetical protein